jgi:hypothetical protein
VSRVGSFSHITIGFQLANSHEIKAGYSTFPPRAGFQPGADIGIREPIPLTAPGEKTPAEYMAEALIELRDNLKAVVKMAGDATKVFDQYQPQTLLAESETTITLQPSWEYTERVESLLITGPAAATVTVQLGDRVWPLIIGVSGYIYFDKLGVLLGRSDVRQLTASVPGNYSFELMGHADNRW